MEYFIAVKNNEDLSDWSEKLPKVNEWKMQGAEQYI